MARTKQQMLRSRASRTFKKPAFSRKPATQLVRTERRSDAIVASRGRSTNAAIRTLLETEEKYFDTSFSGSTSVSATAAGAEMDPSTVLCLNAMVQGDSATTREGNKIVVTGVNIRGYLAQQSASDAADLPKATFSRIFLVQDRQTTGGSAATGTQLNSEDVFKNIAGTAAGAADVFRNRDHSSRYKVLAEATITGPPVPGATDGASTISYGGYNLPFEIYWKGKIPVKFQSNNGTIADIVDNSLHVIGYSAQVSHTAVYSARVTFLG